MIDNLTGETATAKFEERRRSCGFVASWLRGFVAPKEHSL
jgi:hypothetical protein